MSPLPYVSEVHREPARDDEHRVDADVIARTDIARGKLFGGGGDAAQAIAVERYRCGVGGGTLLDLDEGDHLAAPGDEVDLAAAQFDALGEDPPAVEPEPPGGEGLGATAALLGFPAVQSPEPRTRARA